MGDTRSLSWEESRQQQACPSQFGGSKIASKPNYGIENSASVP